jgi:carbon monoxide dehydrogenase subunit G
MSAFEMLTVVLSELSVATTPMATITRSLHIAALPELVWALLSDFGSISAWAPNVDHSCLMSDQQSDAGTARRIQTGRTTLVETVQTWEPNVTLGYRLEGLPPVVKSVTNTWTLEASGTGTNTTLTSEIDTGNKPPQKIAAKAVGRILGKASDEMLSGLKAKAESQS